MSMGTRAQHLQRRFGRHEGFAAECKAHQLDDGVGQMGEIADGNVFDLAVLAVGASQQLGGVDAIFVAALGSDDMHGILTCRHACHCSANIGEVNTI